LCIGDGGACVDDVPKKETFVLQRQAKFAQVSTQQASTQLAWCNLDSASWDAGYGSCSTYAAGKKNRNYCNGDYKNGYYAHQVCPQCGNCQASFVGAKQADNTHCFGKDGSTRVNIGTRNTLEECAETAAKLSSCGSAFVYHFGNKWCGCGKAGTANSDCRESVDANQVGTVYNQPFESGGDETMVGDGAVYRGWQEHASNAKVCQKWTSQSPHAHTRTPQNYASSGLGDHNYCRNPDGEPTIWCYTTDPASRYAYCDPKAEFQKGDRVQSIWTKAEGGDDQWYPATVTEVGAANTVTIKDDGDGTQWTGSSQYVHFLPFKNGDRVQTVWTKAEGGDDKWYPATITGVPSANTVTIKYDDGSYWTGSSNWVRRLL